MNIDWPSIPLFADLEPDAIKVIKNLFQRVRMDSNTTVIAEGTAGDEMFILVKGRVKVTKSMLLSDVDIPIPGLQNSRKVLATLDSSQFPFFGEMALLDRDVRSASVETLEPAEFLQTHRDAFFSLTSNHPRIGVRLLTNLGRLLAQNIRKGNKEQVKLTTALALALSRHRI
ncbi:MAG: Crp/Fnr family transcriptional regulator [Deltaproteobacteria bacterium]|nr:MAG: Crp/Fnr family transcriptional regulator [Deltaproteobacteria bacterium]